MDEYLKQEVVGEIIATLQQDDKEGIKEYFCDFYCKFPEEYSSMYKDVDEAQDNLLREKCEYCPLNKI